MEQQQANPEAEFGVTQFSDWTFEEFDALQTFRADNDNIRGNISGIPQGATIDWRDKGLVSPVKNQGACGSCWAFSAIAAVETAVLKEDRNADTKYSEQQVMDCDKANASCSGGFTYKALDYIDKADTTLEHDTDYPYKARDESCHHDAAKGDNLPGDYDIVPVNNVGEALQKGPIAVAVYASTWSSYKSGVFKCSRPITSKF